MRHPPDIPEKFESDYGTIGRPLCTKVAQLRQGISSLKPNVLTFRTTALTPTTPTTPTSNPLFIATAGLLPTTPSSPAVSVPTPMVFTTGGLTTTQSPVPGSTSK